MPLWKMLPSKDNPEVLGLLLAIDCGKSIPLGLDLTVPTKIRRTLPDATMHELYRHYLPTSLVFSFVLHTTGAKVNRHV